jgi:hypothetical protein
MTDPDIPWSSQVGQDKLIHKLTRQLNGGYFVDLAANDATFISNTYILETKYGWNGLCIEANSRYWSRLAYRKCTIVGAVIGHNRLEEIEFNFGKAAEQTVINFEPSGADNREGAFGGIVDPRFDNTPNRTRNSQEGLASLVKRSTVTLEEVLDRFNAPTVIDYMSLDVEGAETYIMEGFPFHKYMFKIMTVERPKHELRALLSAHGYTFLMKISTWGETVWINEAFRDEFDLNSTDVP